MKIKSILIICSLLSAPGFHAIAQEKTTSKKDTTWVDFERQHEKKLLANDNLNLVISDMAPSVEADNDLNFYVTDLSIIQRADSILSDTSKWNRHDDRNCADDIAKDKYSLFCTLYKASIDVAGEYLHRRTVMQAIRFVIGEDFHSRFNHHRLMDFNNNPETNFKDVKEVLKKTAEEIKKQLNEKEQVLTAIHRFFNAVNEHNPTNIKSTFADGAVNHYVIDKNGQVFTGKQFPSDMSSAKGGVISEKISGDVALRVTNRIATAWVPYDLTDNNKLSHHGTNVFTFIKSNRGWLITSLSYTIENKMPVDVTDE